VRSETDRAIGNLLVQLDRVAFKAVTVNKFGDVDGFGLTKTVL